MDLKKQWQLGLALIAGLLLILPVVSMILAPAADFLSFVVRLGALWGMVGLCLSSMLNMNKRVLYQKFGLKFMKVHHATAIFALITATLHPVAFAIQQSNIRVFIPDVSSWLSFWTLAGRPALILIYIALVAALLRKFSKQAWRYLHYLMYVAIIFIFIHGILIGTDFASVWVLILYAVLTSLTAGMFIYLRIQEWQRTKKRSGKQQE